VETVEVDKALTPDARVAGCGEEMDGLRVGINADRKGREFRDALARRGADVTWGPSMRVVPPIEDALLPHETDLLLASTPTYIVVSTASGLTAWLDALPASTRQAVLDLMGRTPLVARGAKGVGALRGLGLSPVFVSPRETTADVVDWISDRLNPGDTVGVQVHGGEALGELATLRRRGGTTVTVTPYRWALPVDVAPAQLLVHRIIDGAVDVLACTSAPSIRLLFDIAVQAQAADELRAALRNGTAAAAIGNVTAAAFEDLGVPVVLMPTRPRTGELIRGIDAWSQRRDTSRGPLELAPSARAVRAGTRVVVFGQQEFDVIAALVRRPGVACRTDRLAMEAFGHDSPPDATVVRHHLSRIRSKLGPLGSHIQTVRRVGYRYSPG